MGVCEYIEFRKGTESLAKALAKSEAFTVIIGQDTIDTALESIDKESRSFISMGGRTALRYIMGYKLKVLEAMEERLK